MSVTLRALSALLHYPDEDLRAAIPAIREAVVREGLLDAARLRQLDQLLFQLSGGELLAHQEHYVDVFDRGRQHCLHLFEHVHGESRDRGQAMVDLRERYLAAGLDPASNELPDYLPLFLEYCSTLPLATALAELAEPGAILALLADRLERRGTPYAAILAILCDLAGTEREGSETAGPVEDVNDLVALDAAWQEQEITFGAMAPAAPNDAPACPQAAAMVSRFLEPQAAAVAGRSQ